MADQKNQDGTKKLNFSLKQDVTKEAFQNQKAIVDKRKKEIMAKTVVTAQSLKKEFTY